MITVDVINTFLVVWLKPMLLLALFSSIANSSYRFSAAASHWHLACALFVTFFGATIVYWLPSIHLAVLPQYVEPWTSVGISLAPTSFSWFYLTLCLYVLGAVWIFSYQGFGLWEIRAITRDASRVNDPCVDSINREIKALYGIQKEIQVFCTDKLNSPVMWGHRAPVILLPKNFTCWDSCRLKRVLAHEFSHIDRNDWLIKISVKFICAFLWVVPLVWIVARKLEWFAELSCDDNVVQSLNCRAEYAEDLLQLSSDQNTSSWTLALINSSDIYKRIQHVLDGRNQRSSVNKRAKTANVVISLLLVLPVSAMYAIPKSDSEFSTEHQFISMEIKEDERKGLPPERIKPAPTLPSIDKFIRILPDSPKFTEEVLVFPTQTDVSLSNKEISQDWMKESALSAIPTPMLEIKGILPRVMSTPVYPEKAIRRGIEGSVIVQFDIDINGEIINPRIVSSQPKRIFDKAVLKALSKSKFSPMEIDGQPIITKNITETFTFKLFERTTEKPARAIRPIRTQIAEYDTQ